MFDKARRGDLAGRIDNTSDGALRSDLVPDAPARIHRLKRLLVECCSRLRLVEIPPGQAVDGRHDSCVGAQQRHQVVEDHRDGMRLDGEDHIILRAEIGRPVACRKAVAGYLAVLLESQSVRPDGFQMRAAGDKAYLGACLVQGCADIAADGAGAEYTDTCHRFAPLGLWLRPLTSLRGPASGQGRSAAACRWRLSGFRRGTRCASGS